jgi:hypothetical protein
LNLMFQRAQFCREDGRKRRKLERDDQTRQN